MLFKFCLKMLLLDCPMGFERMFETQCYKFMEVPFKTFYDMQEICLDMGGYLVEFNIYEEQLTLRPYVLGKGIDHNFMMFFSTLIFKQVESKWIGVPELNF